MFSSTIASSLASALAARDDAALELSPYGYRPATANTVAYLVVFSLLTAAHFGLAIKYKYWSAFVTMVTGGLLEILGWAGRRWSSENLGIWDPFLMQICCLIIAPVFFSAWLYMVLGECIKRLGAQYSIVSPRYYMIIFIVADIVSLVLQAIGGGGAAVQAQNNEDTTKNTHIMLAGILFQLGTTTLFVAFAIDFMVRVMWEKPYPNTWTFMRGYKPKSAAADVEKHDNSGSGPIAHQSSSSSTDGGQYHHRLATKGAAHASDDPWLRRAQYLLMGVAFATLMIYIRGIYRSIELAQGWDGSIITNENYFVWLDGFPMVLCMAALAVAHPGFLLPPRKWGNK